MEGIAGQVTVEELEQRFRAAKDVVERSHFQAIWLLAKGHSTAEVAEIVALTPRWVNKLARRYEAPPRREAPPPRQESRDRSDSDNDNGGGSSSESSRFSRGGRDRED